MMVAKDISINVKKVYTKICVKICNLQYDLKKFEIDSLLTKLLQKKNKIIIRLVKNSAIF